MISSLFEKKTEKEFDTLAKKQAKLNEKKDDAVKKAMDEIDPETLINVFDVVENSGHPHEIKLSKIIKKKYSSGKKLDFDDLMNLDSLYKSNLKSFSKKDVDDE